MNGERGSHKVGLPRQEASLRFPEVLFINVANVSGERCLLEKRFNTIFMLAAVTGCYVGNLLYYISTRWVDVMGWLSSFWPWESDNVRSFKNIGFMYVLLVGVPAALYWWHVSVKCMPRIKMVESKNWEFALYMACGFFETVIALFISVKLDNPLLAIALQTIGFFFLALWYRRHPTGS